MDAKGRMKPINTDSLSNWENVLPEDVRNDVEKIAPMLQIVNNNVLRYRLVFLKSIILIIILIYFEAYTAHCV